MKFFRIKKTCKEKKKENQNNESKTFLKLTVIEVNSAIPFLKSSRVSWCSMLSNKNQQLKNYSRKFIVFLTSKSEGYHENTREKVQSNLWKLFFICFGC